MARGGSIRDFLLDSISFNVTGDADFEEQFADSNTTSTPTSGEPTQDVQKVVPSIKGIQLSCAGSEYELLVDMSSSGAYYNGSYTRSDGDVVQFRATVSVAKRSSKSTVADVELNCKTRPVVSLA